MTLAYGLSFLVLSNSHIILSHQLPERMSTLSGVIVAFQNVAAMISPIATGIIIQNEGKENVLQGFNYSFLMISGIIMIVAVLFILFVHPDKKKEKLDISNLEKAPNSI
ncbi:hypothetical protein [Bacillus massiliigorillae]|uniref:hypothetical protein n=1 Tax=Bacillus massiliigorillae TaxID=1243664 RepID=UPI001E291473|nr:hypothetical protein [Bacillus massiliigorillae]